MNQLASGSFFEKPGRWAPVKPPTNIAQAWHYRLLSKTAAETCHKQWRPGCPRYGELLATPSTCQPQPQLPLLPSWPISLKGALNPMTDWCHSLKAQPLAQLGTILKWPFHLQISPGGQPRLSLDCITAGSFLLPTSASLTFCPQVQTPKALLVNILLAELYLSLYPGELQWQQRQPLSEATLGTASPTSEVTVHDPPTGFPGAQSVCSSSSMNPPELSSQNWLLLSFSKYSPNHHHLRFPDTAGSPCHRLSVIDQGKNGQEFATKYSKKYWIYHLPAPKWYCFSKSISFSTPWFNGFHWFMKYFLLPRAYCKHLYKIEFLVEQVTFLLNFNISRRKKGVFPTQIFFEQVFKWVPRCQDLSSADSQYNHQLVKQTLKFTPV